MRLEVGTVKLASRVCLGAVLLGTGLGLFNEVVRHDPTLVTSGRAMHAFDLYCVTMLGFAAFPATRRSDIAKVAVLGAALLQIARLLSHHECDPFEMVFDVLGACAVFSGSFLERFRTLTRADPHEPFSMIYPSNRRASRSRKSATPSSCPPPSFLVTR